MPGDMSWSYGDSESARAHVQCTSSLPVHAPDLTACHRALCAAAIGRGSQTARVSSDTQAGALWLAWWPALPSTCLGTARPGLGSSLTRSSSTSRCLKTERPMAPSTRLMVESPQHLVTFSKLMPPVQCQLEAVWTSLTAAPRIKPLKTMFACKAPQTLRLPPKRGCQCLKRSQTTQRRLGASSSW